MYNLYQVLENIADDSLDLKLNLADYHCGGVADFFERLDLEIAYENVLNWDKIDYTFHTFWRSDDGKYHDDEISLNHNEFVCDDVGKFQENLIAVLKPKLRCDDLMVLDMTLHVADTRPEEMFVRILRNLEDNDELCARLTIKPPVQSNIEEFVKLVNLHALFCNCDGDDWERHIYFFYDDITYTFNIEYNRGGKHEHREIELDSDSSFLKRITLSELPEVLIRWVSRIKYEHNMTDVKIVDMTIRFINR